MKKILLLAIFSFVSSVQAQNRIENNSPLLKSIKVEQNIDYKELISGFEVLGDVELSSSAINLVEIGTKPIILCMVLVDCLFLGT